MKKSLIKRWMPQTETDSQCFLLEYDNMSDIANSINSKKVFINLGVDDLDMEYGRIRELEIGDHLALIRYIHVFSPYWYVPFMDPDGNPIEIKGAHKE